jgi:hypothetical protein
METIRVCLIRQCRALYLKRNASNRNASQSQNAHLDTAGGPEIDQVPEIDDVNEVLAHPSLGGVPEIDQVMDQARPLAPLLWYKKKNQSPSVFVPNLE